MNLNLRLGVRHVHMMGCVTWLLTLDLLETHSRFFSKVDQVITTQPCSRLAYVHVCMHVLHIVITKDCYLLMIY